MLSGFNRRAGERNRFYTRRSESHLAPECPQRKQGRPASMSKPPAGNKAPPSSFSFFFLGNSASVCLGESRFPKRGSDTCERSCSTTSGAGSQLICTKGDRVVVLDTGVTANLLRFGWGKWVFPARYPCLFRRDLSLAAAGRVMRALVRISRWALRACVLDEDIPASFC